MQIIDRHGSLHATPDFEDHAKVLDGASDLLAAIFGPAAGHGRSVIGVNSLRKGVPLTLKAIVEVKPTSASSVPPSGTRIELRAEPPSGAFWEY